MNEETQIIINRTHYTKNHWEFYLLFLNIFVSVFVPRGKPLAFIVPVEQREIITEKKETSISVYFIKFVSFQSWLYFSVVFDFLCALFLLITYVNRVNIYREIPKKDKDQ